MQLLKDDVDMYGFPRSLIHPNKLEASSVKRYEA